MFFDHSIKVNKPKSEIMSRGFKSIVYTVNARDQTACHKSMHKRFSYLLKLYMYACDLIINFGSQL